MVRYDTKTFSNSRLCLSVVAGIPECPFVPQYHFMPHWHFLLLQNIRFQSCIILCCSVAPCLKYNSYGWHLLIKLKYLAMYKT